MVRAKQRFVEVYTQVYRMLRRAEGLMSRSELGHWRETLRVAREDKDCQFYAVAE